MIVAIRKCPIGEWVLAPGEKLTREMELALPPGRVKQMLDQRWLEEVVDETATARTVDDLQFRVEKLETQVAQLLVSQAKASTAAAKAAPATKKVG